MALTGEKLRQLLKVNTLRQKSKKRNERQRILLNGKCIEKEEDEDDEDFEDFWKDQYINCYVITRRGRMSSHKWMKIYSSYGLKNSLEKTQAAIEDPLAHPDMYTTSVVKDDLVFKRILLKDLSIGVKRPRLKCTYVYVFDKELTENRVKKPISDNFRKLAIKSNNTNDERASVRRRRGRDSRDRHSVSCSNEDELIEAPPPVPPKPDNLPKFNITVHRKLTKSGKLSQKEEHIADNKLNRREDSEVEKVGDDDDDDDGGDDELETNNGDLQNVAVSLNITKLYTTKKPSSTELQEIISLDIADDDDEATEIAGESSIGLLNVNEMKSLNVNNDDEENDYEAVELNSIERKRKKIIETNEMPSLPMTSSASRKTSGAVTEEFGGMFQDIKNSDRRGYQEHRKDSSVRRTISAKSGLCGYESKFKEKRKGLNNHNSDSIDRFFSESKEVRNNLYEISSPGSIREVGIQLPKMIQPRTDKGSESSDTDTYEELDTNSNNCLNKFYSEDSLFQQKHENADLLVIHKDDILIVEIRDAFQLSSMNNTTYPLEIDNLSAFAGTSMAYNKDGYAVYVPSERLKSYGDPAGEPWFYPLEITSREATLFLRSEQQEGCFLIYRSSSSAYNLSVSRGNGDVLHYHILEGNEGGFMVDGHDMSFLNLADLVEYFRRNKSTLATRLRRPLKEAKLPITAGHHYDSSYELDRRYLSLTGNIIGKGNFGVVCSGVYRTSHVAVKVLQGTDVSLADDDDFIEEARVLMLLKHEHIVRIVGVSSSIRPFFIVTEYIEHGNLKECLRNGRIPFDNTEVLSDICIQMLAALSYLESIRFVLHRDIAARNFLVADLKCIKLADFGRARVVSDDIYQAPRTEKISIKWAAPEVLIDFYYSTKSDVWAVGVAMWELYSVGQRPYESLSAEQTAVYVTEGGRLPRPTLCSDELYSSVITKCWRRSFSIRPSAATLHQVIVDSRRNSVYRRNQRKTNLLNPSSSVPSSPPPPLPHPRKPQPTTPKLKERHLEGDSGGGKQRFSVIRDVFMTNYPAKENRNVGVQSSHDTSMQATSSSSENLSLANISIRDEATTGSKIRKSFRKFIDMKKLRTGGSKSKADFVESEKEKSCTVTVTDV